MEDTGNGRGGSFLGGAQLGVRKMQPAKFAQVAPSPFTPHSVFDKNQVIKRANGNSTEDQSRRMMGGTGANSTPNGQSDTTFEDRRWTGGNTSRSFG